MWGVMLVTGQKSKCCGCGACKDICTHDAIEMVEDEKGFLYPVINSSICVNCGACESICALKSQPEDECSTILGTYALRHKNKKVLTLSSSGGAFTVFSNAILKKGGVVYGAWLNTESFEVKHVCTHNEAERDALRGSKYVQSSTCGIYREIKKELKTGKEILFSGTPCQCAELVKYIGIKPENLTIIDLLCHGVPSNKLLKNHIAIWESKTGKKAQNYVYRSKKYGYAHTHEIIFSDGTKNSSVELKRLLKLYAISMRESCYDCPYASKHRYGDITIGDLWEAGKIASIHDCLGTSLVLTNTEKGEQLLKDAEQECNIFPVDISSLHPGSLYKAVERTRRVDEFWNDYENKGYMFVLDKYAPNTIKSWGYQHMLRAIHVLGLDGIYSRIKR